MVDRCFTSTNTNVGHESRYLPPTRQLDKLEFTDFQTTVPGPGEVMVQQRTAALNRLDPWVRNGWPGIRLAYPHIPGAGGPPKSQP